MNTQSDMNPIFETERFTLVPLSPVQARLLAEILLQDERLAAMVPWLPDKAREGALREARMIELQAAAGQMKMWSIINHKHRLQIGAIIARRSFQGLDVEVLVASRFWGMDVADEAGEPVIDWLEDHSEAIVSFPAILH